MGARSAHLPNSALSVLASTGVEKSFSSQVRPRLRMTVGLLTSRWRLVSQHEQLHARNQPALSWPREPGAGAAGAALLGGELLANFTEPHAGVNVLPAVSHLGVEGAHAPRAVGALGHREPRLQVSVDALSLDQLALAGGQELLDPQIDAHGIDPQGRHRDALGPGDLPQTFRYQRPRASSERFLAPN